VASGLVDCAHGLFPQLLFADGGLNHALRRALRSMLMVLLLLWSTWAWAGGYYQGENGAEALGRGGAVFASVDDASALYFNPANLALLDGLSIVFGAQLTGANVSFLRDGVDRRVMPDETGEIPSPDFGERYETRFTAVERECGDALFCTPLGYTAPMFFAGYGGEGWGVAAGVFPPPALGSASFPLDGAQRYAMTSEDISLAWFGLGGAYQLGPVRIGATFAMGRLDFSYSLVLDANTGVLGNPGVSRAYSGESSELYWQVFDVPTTLTAGAWAPAGILGLTWDVLPELQLALSLQSMTEFALEGELSMDFEGTAIPAELAKLSDDRISSSYTHPWLLRLGARWVYERAGEALFDLELALTYESWSQLDVMNIDVAGGFGEGDAVEPIGRIKLPRDWEDSFGVRVGSDLHLLEWWTLRVGAMMETGSVPEQTTNLDVYSFNRLGVGLGSSVYLPHGFELAVGYQHIFQASRTVKNSQVRSNIPLSACMPPYDDASACAQPGTPPGEPVNNGVFESSFDLFSLVVGYRL
jgi:long-subunit fatty acid transport protein